MEMQYNEQFQTNTKLPANLLQTACAPFFTKISERPKNLSAR